MDSKTMNGIQTKVFCPACGNEAEMLLEKENIPDGLFKVLRGMGLPVGNETAFKGEVECRCGNIVKITFVIEAYPIGEERPNHQIIMRGGM